MIHNVRKDSDCRLCCVREYFISVLGNFLGTMSILRRTVTATTSRILFENETPRIEVHIGPAMESNPQPSLDTYRTETKHTSKCSSLSSNKRLSDGHCPMKSSSMSSSKETLASNMSKQTEASSMSKQTMNSIHTLSSQHTVASQHSNHLKTGSDPSLASQLTLASQKTTTKSSQQSIRCPQTEKIQTGGMCISSIYRTAFWGRGGASARRNCA